MSQTSDAPSESTPHPTEGSVAPGLMFSTLVAVALAIAVAHAPAALRLLGLSFAIYGAIVGLVVATVIRYAGSSKKLPLARLSALLTLLGLVLATELSHRRFVGLLADRSDWAKVALISEAIRQDSQTGQQESEIAEIGRTFGRAADEKRNQSRLTSYLVYRLRSVGKFSETVAVICWIIELCLASCLAACVARRWTARDAQQPIPSQ